MPAIETDYFSDPALIDDPAPYFNALRGACPVLREPYHGSVMVTGYDAATEVLTSRDGTSPPAFRSPGRSRRCRSIRTAMTSPPSTTMCAMTCPGPGTWSATTATSTRD